MTTIMTKDVLIPHQHRRIYAGYSDSFPAEVLLEAWDTSVSVKMSNVSFGGKPLAKAKRDRL
jgi:hypothetical protein